jgi:PAS domain S-box-containing protein
MRKREGLKKENNSLSSTVKERKQETQSVSDSERFFRSVYENANDAIVLMDGDTFIDCNCKTEEMFGCRCDEILGSKPYEFSPPCQPDGSDSRKKSLEYIRTALAGSPQFFEWKYCRKDGLLFDAEVGLSRVDIEGQTVIQVIVRDVTRRKKAEEALQKAYEELETRVEQRTAELKKANEFLEREVAQRKEAQEALLQSEAKYREFIEQVDSIVLEMDADGKVTFINKYGREFFGYKKSEILGWSVLGTIVPETDNSGLDLRRHIQNILHDPEKYFSSENENMRKNGERVWIAWTNRVIFNPEQGRSEILCIGIDRTEQKRRRNGSTSIAGKGRCLRAQPSGS